MIALFALLGVLVFGLYFNILFNQPTNWDDPGLVDNPQIYYPTMDNLKRIFTITGIGTWQPVRDLSYVIDHALLPGNVITAMHLHNMTLYYILTIAVFLFLNELFKAFGSAEDRSFTWAAASALIFAAHPVHVECVAWLYARKEPLFGLFTMLSLWAFIRARTGQAGYFMASAIFLLLAVLSKPTALVVPAVMLVIDIALQLRDPERGYFKKRLAFFGFALLLVLPLSFWLVRMMMTAGGIKPLHGGSFGSNLLAVSQILFEYLFLYTFNVHYVADYPIRLYTSFSDWHAWLYVILNASLMTAAVLSLASRRYILAIFIAWHYIFVLPVSHIFPISQTMADRYALLSSLSLCVLIGYAVTLVRYDLPGLRPMPARFPAAAAIIILAAVMAFYSALTLRQTFIWRNSKTLWENTISRFPNSNSANVNLSVVYIYEGRLVEAQQLCVNAIKELPRDYFAISNLALAQMLMRQYDNAIHNFNEALALRPDMDKPKLGIANCFWEKGDWKTSYIIYTSILKSGLSLDNAPYGGLVYSRMAFAAFRLGRKSESETYLDKASKLNNRHVDSLTTLIDVATTMGRKDIALKAFEQLYSMITDTQARDLIRQRMERLGLK